MGLTPSRCQPALHHRQGIPFEGGHRLPGLPPEHKCSRQHGHSYEVEVILTAPSLEEPGFVTTSARCPLQEVRGHRA